jgi:hypothetical protein
MVRMSIFISLPCGLLFQRQVEFLALDQGMDEVLLGRPLLAALEFDLSNEGCSKELAFFRVECGSVILLSQVLSIRVMLEILVETTALY